MDYGNWQRQVLEVLWNSQPDMSLTRNMPAEMHETIFAAEVLAAGTGSETALVSRAVEGV
jgi:hypothetical protein